MFSWWVMTLLKTLEVTVILQVIINFRSARRLRSLTTSNSVSLKCRVIRVVGNPLNYGCTAFSFFDSFSGYKSV